MVLISSPYLVDAHRVQFDLISSGEMSAYTQPGELSPDERFAADLERAKRESLEEYQRQVQSGPVCRSTPATQIGLSSQSIQRPNLDHDKEIAKALSFDNEAELMSWVLEMSKFDTPSANAQLPSAASPSRSTAFLKPSSTEKRRSSSVDEDALARVLAEYGGFLTSQEAAALNASLKDTSDFQKQKDDIFRICRRRIRELNDDLYKASSSIPKQASKIKSLEQEVERAKKQASVLIYYLYNTPSILGQTFAADETLEIDLHGQTIPDIPNILNNIVIPFVGSRSQFVLITGRGTNIFTGICVIKDVIEKYLVLRNYEVDPVKGNPGAIRVSGPFRNEGWDD
ncbi:hypothetical protein HDV00_006282 [Rhizophlyctis rosea]|nr:hypothetical protein HDV00_006282 [Rhizophlyctis rosea]